MTCGDTESLTRAFLLLWGGQGSVPSKRRGANLTPSDFSVPIGLPRAPLSSQSLQAEPPCCPPLAEIALSPPPTPPLQTTAK